ncbi:MAG: hypothetical protein WC683_05195 [bacterium]
MDETEYQKWCRIKSDQIRERARELGASPLMVLHDIQIEILKAETAAMTTVKPRDPVLVLQGRG